MLEMKQQDLLELYQLLELYEGRMENGKGQTRQD